MKRILVVEDLPETQVWLEGLVRAAFPGCEVDHAATQDQGIARGVAGGHDLALVDLGLPDGSGLEVIRALRAAHPSMACVVATVMGDDTHIVAALAAGATGYLLKEQAEEILTLQLKQMAGGIPPLSPPVARRIMEHFRLTGPRTPPQTHLTARERDVLALIARGLRITDAALALGLAEGTITTHIKAIYRKLDIGTRAEAALHATRMGLLDPERRE